MKGQDGLLKYFTTAMGPKLIKLEFMQLSEMGGKWECLQWSSVQTHIIPPTSMSWEEEKSRLFFQKQNGKSKISNLTADILRNWCHKCSLDGFPETCNVKKRRCRSEEWCKLTLQHDGAALSQWRKMGKALVSDDISNARILLLQPFLFIKSVHHDCLDRGDALNVAHSGDRFDLQTPRPWNDDDAKCSETFFCSIFFWDRIQHHLRTNLTIFRVVQRTV